MKSGPTFYSQTKTDGFLLTNLEDGKIMLFKKNTSYWKLELHELCKKMPWVSFLKSEILKFSTKNWGIEMKWMFSPPCVV